MTRNRYDFSVVPQKQRHRQESERSRVEVRVRQLREFYDPEWLFFHILNHEPYSFWLDSSRIERGLSRFSYMGAYGGPLSQVVKYHTGASNLEVTRNGITSYWAESIFTYLDRELARLHTLSTELPFDLNCGFVGYFGYELKAECGSTLTYASPFPDAMFVFADRVIVFDHAEKHMYLVCLVEQYDTMAAEEWFDALEQRLQDLPPSALTLSSDKVSNSEPLQFFLSRSYHHYLRDIDACKHYLTEGETYEVCLTNSLKISSSIDPLLLYRHLRRRNAAPYAAFLRFNDMAILCSSPERFLRIDRDGHVEAKPIKGTIARGKDRAEDVLNKEMLSTSEKDRAENLMIVDLLRNDLGRVCEVGSIHVPKLMDVESYATVHQLVSTVRGQLRQDLRAIDCICAAFPGGSMTGAPKLRTMEIIDTLEHEARGIYSGALGFLGINGTIDLNIVIRTIVATPWWSTICAGGAIVIQSDPESEFDEMLLKTKALILTILETLRGTCDASQYQIVGGREKSTS